MASGEIDFSFVVPVHNTAGLLARCLDSILKQPGDFRIEVIAVDDGSTDASPEVLAEYARLHPPVRVVTTANHGAGAARNAGIGLATGRLIGFVDSDDHIADGYCEVTAAAMDDDRVDFVNFGLAYVDGDTQASHTTFARFSQPSLEGDRIFESALLDKDVISSPCNKVYRRSFLEAYAIRFPHTRACEDVMFCKVAAFHARKVVFVEDILYIAVIRSGSLTRSVARPLVAEALQVLELEQDYFSARPLTEEQRTLLAAHFVKLLGFQLTTAAFRSRADEYQQAHRLLRASRFFSTMRNATLLKRLPLRNSLMARAASWPRLVRAVCQSCKRLGFSVY